MEEDAGEMPDQDSPRACPFCKEEIKPDAVRCKHCQGSIVAREPQHHGVCPLCKEDIHPEATRCKHCKAELSTRIRGAQTGRRSLIAVRRKNRGVSPAQRDPSITIPTVVIGPDTCSGCDPGMIVMQDGQLYVAELEGCDDDLCYYDNPGGLV